MAENLLEAAISGDFTSMQANDRHNPRFFLGKTPQQNTCLHIFSIHGKTIEFCTEEVTLERSLLEAVNLDDETPLMAAVMNDHVSLAYHLFRRCCELELSTAILQKDKCGFNVLHHAIRNGHEDLALELVTKEPALSQAVSKCNESPMFFAVMRSFDKVCEKLTTSSAYSGGQHGRNCLHAAVRNGDLGIAKTIMGIRPELTKVSDKEGCTPVTHAVLYGKIDMLQEMLKHDSTLGYDINRHGSPLLASAAYRGQVAAARELLKHCPDAPYRNREDKELSQDHSRAPYNKRNAATLLHVAVSYDQLEFVEFVLKTPILRKIVNTQDIHGKTALHYAVQKCNPRIVVALLSHEDIDATVIDNAGHSAAWGLLENMNNAKTLNWNEVKMLLSKANPKEADSLHNLHMEVKNKTSNSSRKDARSLTQTYTSNTSLVAILIATITFAAAFTLPGGYSSDTGGEGLPIMSNKFAFQAFLIFDVLAMCSSFAVAFICIIARWEDYEFLLYYRSFTKKLMWLAFISTTTAFSTGLYTVLTPHLHWLAITICVLVALLPIITWLLGKWPVLKLRFQLGKSFRSDFLDMV